MIPTYLSQYEEILYGINKIMKKKKLQYVSICFFLIIFFGLHNLLLYLRTKLVIIIYVLLTNVEFVNVKICGIFTVLKCQFIVQKIHPTNHKMEHF